MKKQLELSALAGGDVVSGSPAPTSIAVLWTSLVPVYKSRNYGPTMFAVDWDRTIAKKIEAISPKRSFNRRSNYVIPSETARVSQKLKSKHEVSIRFGHEKKGHGYSGERGDFCLIAGVVTKRELVVYYRSLELIGGLAFDLVLLRYLEMELGCNWRTITFVTQKAFVFALKRNSNEGLYPKLRGIFSENR